MRCPNCGAFMPDENKACLMCGANVNNFNQQSMPSSDFSSNGTFGSGSDFQSPSNGGFGKFSGAQSQQPQSNFNDYKKASYAPLKNEDKDIFDKYQEHKTLINGVLFICVVALVIFIGYKYYQGKSEPAKLEPTFQNLYYGEIDGFEMVSGNSQNQVTYIKSGDKGNACSISISYGATTSEDHVLEFFNVKKQALDPDLDSAGNVINELEVYTAQDNKYTLNNTSWYYLNIFYKPSARSDATILRYRYLTSLYKGYFYDIELVNNSNDTTCSSALDSFAQSLKFIET